MTTAIILNFIFLDFRLNDRYCFLRKIPLAEKVVLSERLQYYDFYLSSNGCLLDS
jgi:hypothetical protein